MTGPLVIAECVAIPDGYVIDAQGHRQLVVSLVLRPIPDPAGFPIEEWPSRIAGASVEIAWHKQGQSEADPPVSTMIVAQPGGGATDSHADKATELWKDLWSDSSVLAAALEHWKGSTPSATFIKSYSYGNLATLAKHRVKTDIAITLMAHATRMAGALTADEEARIQDADLVVGIRRRADNPQDRALGLADAQRLGAMPAFFAMPLGDDMGSYGRVAKRADLTPVPGGATFGGVVHDAAVVATLENKFTTVRTALTSGAMIAALPPEQGWRMFDDLRKDSDAPMGIEQFVDPLQQPIYDVNRGLAVAENRLRLNFAAFDLAMAENSSLPEQGDDAPAAPNPDRLIASRYLAGLQAHPTVRKYLRLIVDVPVALNEASLAALVGGGARAYGYVSVRLTGVAASQRRPRTAFVVDSATSLFEPCPQWEHSQSRNPADISRVPSLPLADGFVQLRIGAGGLVPALDSDMRFRLETIDAMASTLSFKSQLQGTLSASNSGATLDELPLDQTGLRTRGIALLDSEAHVPFSVSQDRAIADAARAQPRTLYAEDLVDGYRLDIVDSRNRIFPAGERDIVYPAISRAFGKPVPTGFGNGPTDHPYADFRARDEGYVLPIVRSKTEYDGAGKKTSISIPSENILCWTGSNIGLPKSPPPTPPRTPPTDDAPQVGSQSGAGGDLPIAAEMRFAWDQNGPRLGPILRANKRYRFLMRCRKLNGSSVRSETGRNVLDKHALGNGVNGAPLLFGPAERPPAPVLLIPNDDALNKFASGDLPNEGEARLVVRSDLRPQSTVRRLLLSPRVDFDTAEQAGAFDDSANGEEIAERGVYLRIDMDKGELRPVPESAPPTEPRVGNLFKLQPASAAFRVNPYYADPTVTHIGASLRWSASSPTILQDDPNIDLVPELPFWIGKFTASSLKPICLEIQTLPSSKESGFLTGETTSTFDGDGGPMTVPKLAIGVAPGDELELEIWPIRDSFTTLAGHPVAQAAVNAFIGMRDALALRARGTIGTQSVGNALRIPQGTTPQTLSAATRSAWLRIARHIRLPALHTSLKFTVQHHVAKPLVAPRFAEWYALPGTQRLGMARRKDPADWPRIMGGAPVTQTSDCRPVPSVKDGKLLYLFGGVSFHRNSTGSLLCECGWLDFSPDAARNQTTKPVIQGVSDQPDLFSFEARYRENVLFDIQNIPRSIAGAAGSAVPTRNDADHLDLVWNEAGSLRSFTDPFNDTRARRLAVRMVARSRYATSYPGASPADLSSESAQREELWPVLKSGAENHAGIELLWVPSTARPPLVELTSPKAPRYDRRFRPLPGATGSKGFTLVHRRRVWLGQNWHMSGEGERLAIICAPATGGALPEWLGRSVSRWSSDMTMKPAAPITSDRLPSTAIVTPDVDRRTLRIAEPDGLGTSATPPRQYVIDVALVTPAFDTTIGEWFCDIEITAPGVYRPWIQLSLSRFQEHSVDGCHFSEPVLVPWFLLPQPWSFRATRNQSSVEVVARGQAYSERAPAVSGLMANEDLPQDLADLIHRPVIHAGLHWHTPSGAPLPTVTDDQRLSVQNPVPGIANGGYREWASTFDLPDPDLSFRVEVGVSIVHANAAAQYEMSVDGAIVHVPEPFGGHIMLE